MNSSNKTIVISILVLLGCILSATKPLGATEKRAVILLTRPEGAAEDGWLGALTEQYIRMRIALDDKLEVIDQQAILNKIKNYTDFTRPIPKKSYTRSLSDSGFTHIVNQNFAISDDGSSIQLYMELDDCRENEIVGDFDAKFPVHLLPSKLDSAAIWLSKTLNGNHTAIKEYLHVPFIPSEVVPSDFKALGEMIKLSLESNDSASWSKSGNAFYTVAQQYSYTFMPNTLAGYYLAKSGRWKEAAGALRKALQLIPAYDGMYLLASESLLKAGDYGQVINLIEQAKKYGAPDARMQAFRAQALEKTGKTDQAMKAYESVLQKDAKNREALLFFAKYYDGKDQLQKAAGYAEQALKIDTANGDAWFIVSRNLLGQGKKDRAISSLRKAAQFLPDNYLPGYLLGEIYLEKKLYETAAEFLQGAVNKNPDDLNAALKASYAYEAMGKLNKAYSVLVPLASKVPDNDTLHLRLGLFAFEQKDSSAAFEYLKKYAALEEKNGKALRILGDLYSRYGDQRKAQYYYAKALPLLDSPLPVMFSMAQFHFQKQEVDSAIHMLARIEKENAEFPGLNRALADAWYMKEDGKRALGYYKKARNGGDRDKIVQQRIAQLTFDSGQKEAAAEEYGRLVSNDKNNGQALFRYSLLLLELKKTKEGKRHLQKALTLINPDKEMLVDIAESFERAEAYNEAVEFYSKAVILDSNNDSLSLKLGSCQIKAGNDSAAAQTYVSLFQRRGLDKYKDELKKAGHLFFHIKAYEKARSTYLLYLGSNYTDKQVSLNLAEIEFIREKYEKAADMLGKLPRSSRSSDKYRRLYAESLYKSGNYKKAISALSYALSRNPSDEELLEMLAKSYTEEKKYSDAVVVYKKLIRRYGSKQKRNEYAYDLGQVYEKAGNSNNASWWYEKNISSYGGELRNYLRLGSIYTKQKKLDKALLVYEKAISLPDAPDSLIRKVAQSYAAKKQFDPAAKYYDKYLSKVTNDSAALLELGAIYIEKKEYAKSLKPLEKAVRLMPDNGRAFFMAGHSYLMLGGGSSKAQTIEDAVKYLRHAHDLEPDNIKIMEDYAKALRLRNNDSELIVLLQKWHRVEEKNKEVLLELGELLLKEKKYNEAADAWEIACKLDPKSVSLRLGLAKVHGLRGDKSTRVAHLQAALEYDPKNSNIHMDLARYYREEKQNKKAHGFYTKAIAYNPDLAQARYELASLLHETGKKTEAYEQLYRAVEIEEDNVDYLYALSRVAYNVGKQSVALEKGKKAVSLRADDVELLQWAGYLLFQTGQLEKAKDVFLTGLKVDDGCVSCYRYLGDIAYARQEYDNAIKIYEDALKKGGTNDTITVKLATSLLQNGNVKQARKEFKKAYKQDPENAEALLGLVHSFIRLEKPRKALAEISEYRGDKKGSGYYQLSLGVFYEKTGNLDSAMVAYTMATRILPENAEGYSGCGRVKMARKEYNSAIVYFGKAMAHRPEDVGILLDIGLAYEMSNEYASALSVYDEAIDKAGNVNAYYYKARLQSKTRKFRKAIRTIQAGLQIDPDNPRLYYALGHALRMSNKTKDAIGAYEIAIRKGDEKEFLEAYRQIGLLYYHKMIDNKNAGKYFKKYMKKGGDEKDVVELMKRLEKKN
ncbi:MAG: tetratricopeptide repeat protein [Chitinispirillaceae bacterium]